MTPLNMSRLRALLLNNGVVKYCCTKGGNSFDIHIVGVDGAFHEIHSAFIGFLQNQY